MVLKVSLKLTRKLVWWLLVGDTALAELVNSVDVFFYLLLSCYHLPGLEVW